jgi:hypothetical protein
MPTKTIKGNGPHATPLMLKALPGGTHAEAVSDVTGQAAAAVVTSAAGFTTATFGEPATNLLVLQDITITAITAPGLTNAAALVGRVLSAGVSLPASSITALTISSGIAVLYA